MKQRLFYTFLASFAAIIILGSLINILVIAVSSRRAYTAMIRDDDRVLAEGVADYAARYYRERGTLAGIGELLALPPAFGSGGMRWMGGDRMMMNPRGMMSERPMPFIPALLILGSDGRVYADPQGIAGDRSADELEGIDGTPIRVDGRRVGTVLAGSMIRPALAAGENRFLALVARSALISTLTTALLAILLGGLLFRSISRPVEALAAASSRIGAGELGARVPEGRKDELGELLTRFNRMADSLEGAEEWKRRIISDSAHELRTPVAVLQGELEMILEGVYAPDRERIESLYRETELLTRLIGELGELAAAEGGRMNLRSEAVDLLALAREAASSLGREASAAGVEVIVAPGAVPPVPGDSQKLLQVLRNLISNAVKAVPAGGTVELYPAANEGMSGLAVDDSGPGIPPEEAERIFERFYRIDGARERSKGGSGLGLAISAQIMRLHGGSISVDRGRNGGARFTLLLPRT